MSWFLFAWASKSIRVDGIPLSIISAAVLIIPFHGVLGPMASVIVGLVAGFVAFMFHKHMANRDKKSLIITVATVAASYLALSVMIILASNTLHIWDTGDGIGAWSGTADGMERQIHFDWRTVEAIWIVILAIPGAIIAYKFYERIKLKY
jgi:Amt family ammonium transporter